MIKTYSNFLNISLKTKASYLRLFLTAFLISLLSTSASASGKKTIESPDDSKSKTIIIGGDPWCPYNCFPGHEQPGYAIELLTQIFESAGYTVTYKNILWARSIKFLKSGEIDVLLGISYGGIIDENIFPDAASVSYNDSYAFINPKGITTKIGDGSQANYILTSNSSKWDISKSFEENMNSEMVGLQQGYDYGLVFTQFEKKHPKKVFTVSGDKPLERLIKMAFEKRITVIPEEINVFRYKTKKLGVDEKFKILSTYKNQFPQDQDLLTLFTPANMKRSKLLNTIFSRGLNEYRKNGKLNAILKRYNVKDWR
jgi:polar amino acid transport system substrate-binding protein